MKKKIDGSLMKQYSCTTDFGAFVQKHHCRNCGDIFCEKCILGGIALTAETEAQPVRVCDRCMAEVTQRLSYPMEGAGKIVGMQTQGDLVKKLQEEIKRNRKTSPGVKSEGSRMQMRGVAWNLHSSFTVVVGVRPCIVCEASFLIYSEELTNCK